MPSSSIRKTFHSEQAEKYGINFEYFDAVNGMALDDGEYEALRYTYLRPMSRGEVGCFLSHKALWQKCADMNQAVIIFEDDVILSPEFMAAAEQAYNVKGIDRVNLEGYFPQNKTFGKNTVALNGYQLTQLLEERAGAAAYILWPSGAKKLLAHYNKRATLADVALKMPFMVTYQLEPVVAMQAMVCDHFGIQHDMRQTETTLNTSGKKSGVKMRHFILLRLKRLIDECRKAYYKLKNMGGVRRKVKVDVGKFSSTIKKAK
jgi:glycosyl transferase family 25